jgi:hypothetical protein
MDAVRLALRAESAAPPRLLRSRRAERVKYRDAPRPCGE